MNKSLFQQNLTHKCQKFIHSDVRQSITKKIMATILSITVAFFIALIIACSVCKTWGSFGKVLKQIFTAGYQSKYHNTLFSNMCILIVAGMAFIFAYKAGLFNIGISGQMVMGGTIGTVICHLAKIPTISNQIVVVIASMVGGSFIASIIGALKAYLKVNEVVSSIMFNWIIYFMSILLLANLNIPHDASNLNTNAPANELLLRMDGESYIPLLIITGFVILTMIVILNFSVFGRKLRVTGLSNTGALAAGYNIKANMILSMAISGLISGLLGAMLYCGFSPNMPVTAAGKAIPQEGFNGISVGLISMCSPTAALPVSLFFSMIKTSVSELQMIGIDNHISDVVFGIIVYGAAAITLFLNLKPYWLTLRIFKGKNYSKIQHERNMTNIALLGLSRDQCSSLKKYYIYYVKHRKVKTSLKIPFIVKIRMFFANIQYEFAYYRSKYRVWKNQRRDIVSKKYFYRQEMAHLVIKNKTLVVDKKQKRLGGWWLKLDEKTINSTKTNQIIYECSGLKLTQAVKAQLNEMNNALIKNPFNNRSIRLVARLAYLQNIRNGLSYRLGLTKQNKLVYFSWMQIKQQAENIGLNEIYTKVQYKFAHTAYFKAYYQTYLVVKRHYDMMNKTFKHSKTLDVSTIRFDLMKLEQLYIANLKREINKISYLINCPLTQDQSKVVGEYVLQIKKQEEIIEANQKEAAKCRAQAKNNASGNGHNENDKKYLYKSKIYNINIIKARKAIANLEAKINTITSNARAQENTLETRKWLARKIANEKAQKKLDKIAAKKGM